MSSEPPWYEKPEDPFAIFMKQEERTKRKPLDHHAGYPDGGVKRIDGIGLFSGFGDVLTAQVVCDDAKTMKKALNGLTGLPTRDIFKRSRSKETVMANKARPSVQKTKKGLPVRIYADIQGTEG